MSDYRVEWLSIEKIEGFARDFLADCPKLPSGAIDILAALRQPRIKTIHGYKVLRLKLEADEHLPDDLAHVWSVPIRLTQTPTRYRTPHRTEARAPASKFWFRTD